MPGQRSTTRSLRSRAQKPAQERGKKHPSEGKVRHRTGQAQRQKRRRDAARDTATKRKKYGFVVKPIEESDELEEDPA